MIHVTVMRRTVQRLVGLFPLLLAGLPLGSYSAVQQQMKSASITVGVVDEQGSAVRNARVYFVDRSSGNEQQQVTDETGSATADVQPGMLDLTVSGPGFVSLLLRGVEIKSGEHKEYDLVLKKPTECCQDPEGSIGLETAGAQLGNLQKPSEDECERVAHMQVYSNASFIKEAGDVVGYELAVQPDDGTSTTALLYFYEGVPNKDGIHILGYIAAGKLTMEGDLVEHLIEQPSKKEVVETHHVTVNGSLNSTWFRGSIKIAGLATPVNVRLKRVSHIWMCGG
jgi:hypothetical protein